MNIGGLRGYILGKRDTGIEQRWGEGILVAYTEVWVGLDGRVGGRVDIIAIIDMYMRTGIVYLYLGRKERKEGKEGRKAKFLCLVIVYV